MFQKELGLFLENININLFKLINGSNNSPEIIILFAKFCAEYLLYAIPLFLLVSWIFGDYKKRETALKATFVAFIALEFGQIIIMIYPHPRPFMIGLGHQLIPHAPESSFPSDHATLFSAIAFTYLFAKEYSVGFILFIATLLVSWARIYLGVHFPFDIIGAYILSFLVLMIFNPIWNKIGKYIMYMSLEIYNKIISMVRLGKNN